MNPFQFQISSNPAPILAVSMSLRLKTILTLGGIIALSLALIAWILAGRNQLEFNQLERRDIERDLNRAVNAVRAELGALETTTLDWAVWDDAYGYLKKKNREFEQSVLNSTALGVIDIEYLLLFDNQNNLVEGLQRTPVGNYQKLDQSAIDLADTKRWLWQREAQFIVTGGITEFKGMQYLVASSPVIPSSSVQPPSGRIVMVRRLDRLVVKRLGEQVQLNLELIAAEQINRKPSLIGLLKSNAVSPDFIEMFSPTQAKGYRRINIQDREPPLVLAVNFPRDIYQLGLNSNSRLYLTIAGFGFFLLGLVLSLLERGVLRRLSVLSKELSSIAKNGNISQRVSVQGRDELAYVAQNINAGLTQIEETQVKAVKLEADLQRFQRIAAEELLFKQNSELDAVQFEMFERLALVAEFRDDETAQHTLRVGELSASIAKKMNLPESDCSSLRFAARLHDIGKIGIPDAVLLKPDKLTQSEWELMQTHAAIGAKMLERSNATVLRMAHEIALTHHERWDGKGYPNNLHGNEIPLVGRIVAVADCVDALLSPRPYKSAWTLEQTIAEVKACQGNRYDPEVVEAFLVVIKSMPELVQEEG